MNTRKSYRRSSVVGVERPVGTSKNQPTNQPGPDQKRRKINVPTTEKDDKMDPVEKLLSFSHSNTDMLSEMNATEHETPAATQNTTYPNISYNFNKVIHDNMKSYYAKFRKSQMEIHNDHSSFSVLNQKPATESKEQEEAPTRPKFQVPFFKNVNFNPSPSFGHHIEDYIHYDDDEPLSTDSEQEEIASPKGIDETPIPSLSGKMSFHYRQNDNLNLSLSDEKKIGSEDAHNDVFRFLNKRSVLSGKASEMIGTSSFLVSDFFF